jgi:outer membrane receptor protein involved in Fe transport
LGAEELALSGNVNLADTLNQLPALGSTFTAASSTGFIGTAGLSFLDLRRLGEDRTLVLVDGRRHVAGEAGTAAIDINSIPQELVERVEVVTGGASAIYGADAVSGVVNFIMKKDYEGISLYGQAGDANEGHSATYSLRGTIGGNFNDDKGNAVVTFEVSSSEGFKGTDRSFPNMKRTLVSNPDGPPDSIMIDDGTIDFVTIPGVFCGFEYFVVSTASGCWQPDANGTLVPFNAGRGFDDILGQFSSDGISINGDGTPLDQINGSLQPDIERIITTARVRHEVSPFADLFVEAKYGNTQVKAFNGTGAFDIFDIPITPEYAFLDGASRDIIANSLAGLTFLSRIHNEAERAQDAERQLFRGVFGIEGDLDNGIGYELSYVYGRATNQVQQLNNRINERFFAGIDAVIDPDTGDPVCRISIDPDAVNPVTGEAFSSIVTDFADECVPINVMGAGAMSAEAIDWSHAAGFLNEAVEQNVVSLIVTGETLGFELPAGPIGWAAGAEYRDEYAKSVPTEIDQLGLSFLNVIPPTEGEFDVTEFFGEVSIPLLAGLPAAEELTVDAAVRSADYSTVGGTTTWKAGLSWTPITDIRFRGTVSEAIRAPNIAELFGPQSQTFLFFDDPCDADNIGSGSEDRAANCAALGLPPDFQQDDTRGNTPGTTGGNPDVTEETADTLTFGLVFTPRFVENLAMTIDYWDVEIEDAISTASLDDVLSNCVDGVSIDNQFCPLITRDPTTGQVESFVITNQNFSKLEARGIDIEITYVWDLGGAGVINFRNIATYLDKLNAFPFQIDPDFVDEEKGEVGDPEWSTVFNATWNYDKWTVNYEFRWFDDMLEVEIDEFEANPDIRDNVFTGSTAFHDIQVRYLALDNTELFLGVNNITEEWPPNTRTGSSTNSAMWDNVGRFFYGGVRVNF